MARRSSEVAGPARTDARELLAWLREQRTAMTALLSELARAESPSTDGRSQERVRALLAAELIELGHSVREPAAPGGGRHLVTRPADRRRTGPYQLLIGHLDTVWPLGTLDEMPVRTDGGRLFGPGVFDMKGGLVQAVFALRALRAAGARPEVAPVLVIACDEEIGSRDSGRHITRLARGAARALVLEPAFGPAGALKTRRKAVGAFTLTDHRTGRARRHRPRERGERHPRALAPGPAALRAQRSRPRGSR